jgi:hypothetical protein
MNKTSLLKFTAAIVATLTLAACVQSQQPLITDAKPVLGQQFEVHLYENFVNNKATDVHASVYHWKDGAYVRANGLARDAKQFVAQPLAANDFLLQSAHDSTGLFHYWIGRKLNPGVYLVFPLDEADASEAVRKSACGETQHEGFCRVTTHVQVVALALATAAKPVRNAALGVVLDR